jgi:uncharacterized protein YjbI with pentapeptide repeats
MMHADRAEGNDRVADGAGKRGRWPGGWGLFASSAAVLITGLVVTVGVWIGLTRLLRYHWPWDKQLSHGQAVSQLDITKVALSVVAGVGAAIALTVTYRRQRDVERGHFDERFAAAAAQLGGASPAERLAGVYAIATMADETPERRQQCINLLCAYLRLPYDPDASQMSKLVLESTWSDETPNRREERTYQRLPNDREVRLTIIDVIRAHLLPTASVSWVGYDFDFTGAVFDGGNFIGAQFTGGTVNFNGAQFAGGTVKFIGAQFAGGTVTFNDAQFAGGEVTFSGAQFTGGEVTFSGALFIGGEVTFSYALFMGGAVDFIGAQFTGGTVDFNNAEFTGGTVYLNRAQFTGGTVTLNNAQFAGGTVKFIGAQFAGGTVTFYNAEFIVGAVSFGGAHFTGGRVDFDEDALQAPAPPDLSMAFFGGGVVAIGGSQLTMPPPGPSSRPA